MSSRIAEYKPRGGGGGSDAYYDGKPRSTTRSTRETGGYAGDLTGILMVCGGPAAILYLFHVADTDCAHQLEFNGREPMGMDLLCDTGHTVIERVKPLGQAYNKGLKP